MVRLPKYWPIMGMQETDKLAVSGEAGNVFNATLVYAPDGQRVSRYDKIYLFSFTKDGRILRRGVHHCLWPGSREFRGAVRQG